MLNHFFSEYSCCDNESLEVDMPSGIIDPKYIFAFYSWVFNFPGWFGNNWDALADCLRDITPMNFRRILIKHVDVPFMTGSRDRAIYLDVLLSTCILHRGMLVVTFPNELLDEVDELILAYWKGEYPDIKTKEDVLAIVTSIVFPQGYQV